jgi:hypothetical protein
LWARGQQFVVDRTYRRQPARIRRAATTIGSSAKTISPPTASPATRSPRNAQHPHRRVREPALPARSVRYLAGRGIRQYLDIGAGLPTADNTDEVAQAIDPSAWIVYADNDPLVLTQARAVLTGSRQGGTAYIDADLRDPQKILTDPVLRKTLDLGQPVALMMVAILHFVRDDEHPGRIIDRLVGALASGSYLFPRQPTGSDVPRHPI